MSCLLRRAATDHRVAAVAQRNARGLDVVLQGLQLGDLGGIGQVVQLEARIVRNYSRCPGSGAGDGAGAGTAAAVAAAAVAVAPGAASEADMAPLLRFPT